MNNDRDIPLPSPDDGFISESEGDRIAFPFDLEKAIGRSDSEISERLLLASRQILQWVCKKDEFFSRLAFSRNSDPFSPEFFSRFYMTPSEAVLPEREFVRVLVLRMRDSMALLKTTILENTSGSFPSHSALQVRFFRKNPNGDWYSEIQVSVSPYGMKFRTSRKFPRPLPEFLPKAPGGA